MNAYRALRRVVASLAILSLLTLPIAETQAASSTTFSGRATVLKGTVAGVPVGPLVDTGEVGAEGGELEDSLIEYPIPGVIDPTGGALTATVLHATVVAGGNKSSAEAGVASFGLNVAGQSVAAQFLMANAEAKCTGNTATVAGSSEIVGLTVNGQTITVSGGVGQTIPVPGFGVVIINEQVAAVGADSGDITVNALHIVLTDPVLGTSTDLVVASAHADILCGGPGACPNKDFVTGGGWIVTASGSRANFAVAGGIKNGAYWGHLLYIDHGSGMKVKGAAVTGYAATGATSRHITGETASGQKFDVDVADGGEPGRGTDFFGILLTPSGYGAGSLIAGGNIQLHCK